ncbi:MAG: sterol desaturase family protein, partial [Planctomycetaceae bacterium]
PARPWDVPDAVDKNFAVHTPIWDRLFGTYYLPGRWPRAYGLAHGKSVPAGWPRQFVYPFQEAVSGKESPTLQAADLHTEP